MARGQRVGLILSAIVFAAIAFVVLRPEDADEPPPPADQAGQPPTPTGGEEPAPEPEPRFETIRLANGEVRGGRRRITVSHGDVARIEVRSDAPEEIHVHGYDMTRDVAPGDPARLRFDADIEGVFEIEAHDLGHVTIATLVVEP